MTNFVSEKNKVNDLYMEHELHDDRYEKKCSTCYEEAVSCGERTMYERTCELCMKRNPCFFHKSYNNFGDNYPPGYSRFGME